MTIFQSWTEIGRIVATSVLAYIAIILFIRLLGKRSTSKMNNFDWVVTIALGSITGSMILLKDVVLVDGLVAIVTLLVLQFLTTWLSVRIPFFMRSIHARPALLFYKGHFLEDQMRRERMLKQEVWAAIRAQGYGDLNEVTAVILESSADLSIIGNGDTIEPILLSEVTGTPAPESRM